MPSSTTRESAEAPPGTAAEVERHPRFDLRRIGTPNIVGTLVFFAATLIYFGTQVDNFFSGPNIDGVLTLAVPLGLSAIGQTFVIIGGGFDISITGVAALSSVTYGLLINGHGVLFSTVGALVVGLLSGLVSGALVTRLSVNPLIATLATASITSGTAFAITGGQTKPVTSNSGDFWAGLTSFGVNKEVFILVAFAIIAGVTLRYTAFGRRLFATGGNREAAELGGVRVGAMTISSYAISGVCSGAAGIVLTSQLLGIAPSVGATLALDSIAAVVLGGAALTGGVGGIGGTILGVLILGCIGNGLNLMQVQSYYQTIIKGIVLVIAVVFSQARTLIRQHFG